jgi:hypothetical protein
MHSFIQIQVFILKDLFLPELTFLELNASKIKKKLYIGFNWVFKLTSIYVILSEFTHFNLVELLLVFQGKNWKNNNVILLQFK